MSRAGTVLITGGLGYLGSRLLRDASTRLAGGTIRVLDNLQTHGQRALMGLPENSRVEFLEGDVLDRGVVAAALRGVDTVVHLAALVRTPMSFEHPVWVNQVNHWGTATLVEACLEAEVRRFVFASSTAVYGPGGPFDETANCRPLGPYARSKLEAEKVVRAAGNRDMQVSILRLGSLYGLAPVMRFDGFVNRLAYLAGVGRPLTVYGTGKQRRPIVHVDDASQILLDQALATLAMPLVNVVEDSPSVIDICDAIRVARPDTRIRETEQDVLNHLSFVVDPARLRAIGWRPSHTVKHAVADVVGAFRGVGGVFKDGP